MAETSPSDHPIGSNTKIIMIIALVVACIYLTLVQARRLRNSSNKQLKVNVSMMTTACLLSIRLFTFFRENDLFKVVDKLDIYVFGTHREMSKVMQRS